MPEKPEQRDNDQGTNSVTDSGCQWIGGGSATAISMGLLRHQGEQHGSSVNL